MATNHFRSQLQLTFSPAIVSEEISLKSPKRGKEQKVVGKKLTTGPYGLENQSWAVVYKPLVYKRSQM
ncbi:hypothetical protein TNCT_305331 [Trichonephila clavata]|uniref:Uncharacterized protein n=1 Tax=Trichonephila clavata TaxID=2740835 RepID=A0A8X6FV61_TRICU|nr:hypothetical protein TNCT_305331 [Trichonephila clavata]